MDGAQGWEDATAAPEEAVKLEAAAAIAQATDSAGPVPPPIAVPIAKPIMRGTIVPVAGSGQRKYVWSGEWAMAVSDTITSPFQYSFELPKQYFGPSHATDAVTANPLLPSAEGQQPLSVPMSGYYLVRDKYPDDKLTKVEDSQLRLSVGGPGM
jgi:hypothetical protein